MQTKYNSIFTNTITKLSYTHRIRKKEQNVYCIP